MFIGKSISENVDHPLAKKMGGSTKFLGVVRQIDLFYENFMMIFLILLSINCMFRLEI